MTRSTFLMPNKSTIMQKKGENEPNVFETAAKGWNNAWSSEEGRKRWAIAHPFVVSVLHDLLKRKCKRILDLGCGIGRHSTLFAEHGLEVYSIDQSLKGLSFLRQSASARKLRIGLTLSSFRELPYRDLSFDAVLAFNVIYHGNRDTVVKSIKEIIRISRRPAVFFGTMLSKRNSDFRLGKQVAEDTFLRTHGYDKGHPHFYVDKKELTALLGKFDILSLEEIEHERPCSWHWHFVTTLGVGDT